MSVLAKLPEWTCEEALLSAGQDVRVRFLVLHLYYELTRWARAGIAAATEDDDETDDAEALERTTRALAHLVSLLPIDDCGRQWPLVRWEITNAYAAGLWARAIDLYDLTEREQVVPAPDARLMRGHFRYVWAVEPESRNDPLNDIQWEPRVLGSSEPFHPPSVFDDEFADRLAQAFLYGGAVLRKEPASADALDALRDARNDFEKAMAAVGGRLGGAYEAMLARTYLELGNFANAARRHLALLRRKVNFGDRLGDSGRFRPQVHLQVARSFRAAGQAQDAAATLDAALRDHPNDTSLLMEQADLANVG